MATGGRAGPWRPPLFRGIGHLGRGAVPREVLAGITLAALAVPEVLGYARIAGMPVISGLYTLLLPLVLFAVAGSSRHLVVGADSATAALMAVAVALRAAPGSPQYVRLAGLVALITAVLLLLARVVRLGFLGDFLSRTVLIGFFAGVGVQVAVGQLPDLLGLHSASSSTLGRLADTARTLGSVHPATAAVAAGVVALVVGLRMLTRRIPGALVAVIASIVLSYAADLRGRGVAVLGPVPRGVPHLAAPELSARAATGLLPATVAIFFVVLAQSTATARLYAARYDEPDDDDGDLVGLGLANAAAAFTGAFVVNGSPTKTQMVDDAGGRSQLAQLVTGLVVLLTLLFLTGPLAYLPLAALAAIVFVIGLELIDVRRLRRIRTMRVDEFAVALLTAAVVVVLGVLPGIAFAVVASLVDHLRISYSPRNTVLVPTPRGDLHPAPVSAGARTAAGLVVYRFTNTLYYANSPRLLEDARLIVDEGGAVRCFCLDCVAIGDVDVTGGTVLETLHQQLAARGIRLVFCEVSAPVRAELDRYGITAIAGRDAFFGTSADVVRAGPEGETGG
jgi:sulfate permease, SulP family